MKGGTTSLFRYLVQHPRVAGGIRKEIHFLDLYYRGGRGAYRSRFPTRLGLRARSIRGPVRVVEASPYYLFHPLAPGRARRVLPRARLIALLRDPVSRAYSHYHHAVRRGYETLSFDEAIEREPERVAGEAERIVREPGYQSFHHRHHSYLARGIYVDQIERWYAEFDPGRMLLLESEEFFAHPDRCLTRVLDFLDLPAWDFDTRRTHKAATYPPMDPALRRRLRSWFEPHDERLRERTGIDFRWE